MNTIITLYKAALDPTLPENTRELTVPAGEAAYWGNLCLTLLGDYLAGANWVTEEPCLPYLGFIALPDASEVLGVVN
jgi:hypothetical protein